jgi:hypothetical protein
MPHTVAGQWRFFTAFPFVSSPLVIVVKYPGAAGGNLVEYTKVQAVQSQIGRGCDHRHNTRAAAG